jgi:hypothetical protein
VSQVLAGSWLDAVLHMLTEVVDVELLVLPCTAAPARNPKVRI